VDSERGRRLTEPLLVLIERLFERAAFGMRQVPFARTRRFG
jgi:hypothetical protein